MNKKTVRFNHRLICNQEFLQQLLQLESTGHN